VRSSLGRARAEGGGLPEVEQRDLAIYEALATPRIARSTTAGLCEWYRVKRKNLDSDIKSRRKRISVILAFTAELGLRA
jgi:hypothetical protein